MVQRKVSTASHYHDIIMGHSAEVIYHMCMGTDLEGTFFHETSFIKAPVPSKKDAALPFVQVALTHEVTNS